MRRGGCLLNDQMGAGTAEPIGMDAGAQRRGTGRDPWLGRARDPARTVIEIKLIRHASGNGRRHNADAGAFE